MRRPDQIPDQYDGPQLPWTSAKIPLLQRNALNNLSIVNPTRQTKAELAA
jgi:hypothetical protein